MTSLESIMNTPKNEIKSLSPEDQLIRRKETAKRIQAKYREAHRDDLNALRRSRYNANVVSAKAFISSYPSILPAPSQQPPILSPTAVLRPSPVFPTPTMSNIIAENIIIPTKRDEECAESLATFVGFLKIAPTLKYFNDNSKLLETEQKLKEMETKLLETEQKLNEFEKTKSNIKLKMSEHMENVDNILGQVNNIQQSLVEKE
jgi:hypothetical protein